MYIYILCDKVVTNTHRQTIYIYIYINHMVYPCFLFLRARALWIYK